MKTDLSIRLAFRSIRTGKFIIFRLLSEMDSGIALATIHSAVALIPPGHIPLFSEPSSHLTQSTLICRVLFRSETSSTCP
jgi:hypothetical protein